MSETVFRLRDLKETRNFAIRPDADGRKAIATDLDLLALRKLSFTGTLSPDGARDWRLDAKLGATVVQPCVVTLEPVTTRIDEPVVRRYLADMPALPEGDEVEMPEDDTAEPLPATIDLADIMREALALALPAFPRADGVEAVDISVTVPGAKPLTDADVKPFAALKSLKKKMGGGDDETP